MGINKGGGALALWLRLTGDEYGGGILPSSSWVRMSLREGIGRTRTVVGSRHLALGANELKGGVRRPPRCQLALLFTTLPALAVASRMGRMVVVVDMFALLAGSLWGGL